MMDTAWSSHNNEHMLLKFIARTWILYVLLVFQALSILPSFINKNGMYMSYSYFTVNLYWWNTTTATATTTTTTTTTTNTTTTDKQGSNNNGSVNQSDANSTPHTFCHNITCTYAYYFKCTKHFYLSRYNIQDEILSHYTGSLLWPILSLLSMAIPVFCKAGSTNFSWI